MVTIWGVRDTQILPITLFIHYYVRGNKHPQEQSCPWWYWSFLGWDWSCPWLRLISPLGETDLTFGWDWSHPWVRLMLPWGKTDLALGWDWSCPVVRLILHLGETDLTLGWDWLANTLVGAGSYESHFLNVCSLNDDDNVGWWGHTNSTHNFICSYIHIKKEGNSYMQRVGTSHDCARTDLT